MKRNTYNAEYSVLTREGCDAGNPDHLCAGSYCVTKFTICTKCAAEAAANGECDTENVRVTAPTPIVVCICEFCGTSVIAVKALSDTEIRIMELEHEYSVSRLDTDTNPVS